MDPFTALLRLQYFSNTQGLCKNGITLNFINFQVPINTITNDDKKIEEIMISYLVCNGERKFGTLSKISHVFNNTRYVFWFFLFNISVIDSSKIFLLYSRPYRPLVESKLKLKTKSTASISDGFSYYKNLFGHTLSLSLRIFSPAFSQFTLSLFSSPKIGIHVDV